MRREVEVKRVRKALVMLAAILAVPLGAAAEEPPAGAAPAAAESAAELAKKLNNPLAAMVSVPFQFNWAQGVGPDEQTRSILNIQPVIPFSVGKDWNMITRLIVPVVGQPPLADGGAPASGIADIQASFFFSPNKGGLIWGAGPVISLPSTSEPTLGSEKWSAGPTFVVLKQSGPWTVGALVNQLWSFAGNEKRDSVSQMLVQPFAAHTFKSAVTVSMSSETTANWKAESDQWSVPINLAVAKMSSFGPFPASYKVGGGIYVAGPKAGPEWQVRAEISILLPRKK